MTALHDRRRATGRSWRRAASAAVASFVASGIVIASALIGLPATAATSIDTAVVPSGSGIVRLGSTASANVTLTNRSAGAHPAGSVTVAVADAPLTTGDELSAWLHGDAPTPASVEVPAQPVDQLDVGTSTTIGVPLPIETLRDRSVGVYPIESRYRVGDQLDTARSVIVVTDGAARGTVTVVAPITAPAIGRGLLTAAQLEELTGPEGELTAQLDAVVGTTAVIAVDPAILASIRVLGTTAPPSATAWLEQLLDSSNPRFALTYGDADLATLFATGADELLAPLPLSAYIIADGLEEPTPEPTPTASEPGVTQVAPTATPPAEPVAPTLDDLLALPGAVQNVWWPATATADVLSASVRAHAQVIVASSVVDGAPGASRMVVDGADVLVQDTDISDALARVATTIAGPARSASLVEVVADTALTVGDDGHLLAVIDRAAMLGPGARSAVTALLGAPFVSAGDLSSVAAGDPAHGTFVGEDPTSPAAGGATIASLLRSEDDIAQLATVLTDPTLLTGRFRAEILQLAGTRWQRTPVSWSEAVETHRTSVEETLNAVAIVPLDQVQVLGSSVGLPLSIRNRLPYPVDLEILAQPDDLRLTVQHSTPVTAQASANSSVRIPVTSRIGNGEVDVRFELRSPTGTVIGEPQIVTLNVRAEWEAIGLVILGSLVAALFGVGIIRTILRRRRVRTQTAAPDGA